MQNQQRKEILDYDFPQGISLIEANAGTGKTFSIELLYLKALLELKLEVQQILLVTFTVEATQQMKKRIFDTLQRCYDFFSQQQNKAEDFPLQQFLEKIQKEKNLSVKKITLLLQKAVVHFDEAAIFSIHSFASRINKESFIKGTIGTASKLHENLARNAGEELFFVFWIAKILPDTDYAKLCYQILNRGEKEILLKFFQEIINKIDIVEIVGNSEVIEFSKNLETSSSEKHFPVLQEKYSQLQKKWQWSDIEKLLETSKIFVNKQKSTVQKHFQTIQKKLTSETQSVENWHEATKEQQSPALKYFIAWFREISSFADAKKNLATNTAASALQKYILAQNDFTSFLRVDFLKFAKKKFAEYKKEQQLYTYDDIISSFYTLSKEQASSQFQLVIIDEFQDTDEIQSQAFLNLFHSNNTRMILVGDPKQSIFRFRGGDLFTYLKMKEHFVADQSYRLDKNWRSQKEIVEMVNLLFSPPRSFLLDNLEYFPSSAILKQSEGVFFEEKPQPAFKVWDCAWNEKETKESLENKILLHLAGEVSRMITLGQQEKLMVGDKKLEPNMICILVPTNENIYKVRQYLAKLDIYASAISKTLLLESLEFLEFWNLLQAVFYYKDKKKIRTVLLSRFFGYSLSELYELEKGYKWEKILEEFRLFHQIWEKKGFALMIEKLVRKKQILKNLLNYGYRSVANFYHSLDFFLNIFKDNLKIETQIKILENLSEELSQNSSKNNLRVESDTNAVQIMTIHNSKGLEFPIVFCPYLWKPYSPSNIPSQKSYFFHSPNKANRQTQNPEKNKKILSYDLSKQNLYKKTIQEEQEAENRRLLYVLLTRAKHQIHLYYSEDYSAKKQSPFVELLEQLKKTENFAKWTKKLPLNSVPDFEKFRFPKTTLKEPKKWMRPLTAVKESYSFSSLTSQKQSSLPETQKEIYKKIITNEKEFKTISEKDRVFYLPSGIEVGNLVHQALDFWQSQQTKTEQEKKEHLKNFIQKKLPFFKIENFWIDTLFTLCQKSYYHRLQIADSQTSLLEISPLNRTGEMKFHLDLKKNELVEKILFLSQKNLTNKVLQSLKEIVLQFTNKEFQNICAGIIDLVFFYKKKYYILDWKTNWLGDKVEDYHSENLDKAMLKHSYFLQYFLYYLALEKFLFAKNSPYGIGGVFYLFVRGLSFENLNLGVYFDKMDYMQPSMTELSH